MKSKVPITFPGKFLVEIECIEYTWNSIFLCISTSKSDLTYLIRKVVSIIYKLFKDNFSRKIKKNNL